MRGCSFHDKTLHLLIPLILEAYPFLRMAFLGSLAEVYLREVKDAQSRLALLDTNNFNYKDQGSALLDVPSDLNRIYAAQGYDGKAAILRVMLRQVRLRGEEADFEWHEPFGTLFSIGELVLRNQEWGE